MKRCTTASLGMVAPGGNNHLDTNSNENSQEYPDYFVLGRMLGREDPAYTTFQSEQPTHCRRSDRTALKALAMLEFDEQRRRPNRHSLPEKLCYSCEQFTIDLGVHLAVELP